MITEAHKSLLRKLLLNYKSNFRFWVGLIVLSLGTILLLLAVIMWSGFQDLLITKSKNDTLGDAYLTINKKVSKAITNQKLSVFNANEIRAISGFSEVKDIGMFNSAHFPVEVSFTDADSQYFSTSLFLESLPSRFIDNKPIDWYWQYDSPEVPVIVSSEFLNLYNFGYAPNEGVPQLTKGTISTLVFNIDIGQYPKNEIFTARVVGFSDRISSILVPESFINFGNEHFSNKPLSLPTRLILQVKDPSDKKLIHFLNVGEYETSGELLRWNKLRVVVEQIGVGMGVLVMVILAISIVVFYLLTDATLSKSKNDLKLLQELGYHPKFLSWFILKWYGLVLLCAMLVSGVVSIIIQVRVSKYLNTQNLELRTFPSYEVWLTLLGIIVLLLLVIARVIRGVLR